jgi:hypothetical protein
MGNNDYIDFINVMVRLIEVFDEIVTGIDGNANIFPP